jgi:Putative zinc-finger
MNPDHARFAEWDAAYVLGALSPAERREYEEHMETCDRCRRSVAELASMPGLLARLSPERAMALLDEPATAVPSGTAVPRPDLLESVRREHRRRRARSTRAWAAAAVAAVVVVLTAVVMPLTFTPSADVEAVELHTVADVPLTATATLTEVGWGTRIDLDCRYAADASVDAPPGGWPYALVVVDREGARSEVSSWSASPGTVARVAAGTAVRLDEIASIEIRAVGSGHVLMRGSPG